MFGGWVTDAESGAWVPILKDQRFNRRVALHRVKGCLKGCKTCERCDPMVVIRGDTYHGGSPRRCFGLLRIELNEVVGCKELADFLGNALKAHGLLA